MLGPSLLFAGAPLALVRATAAVRQRRSALPVTAVVLAALGVGLVVLLLGLGLVEILRN